MQTLPKPIRNIPFAHIEGGIFSNLPPLEQSLIDRFDNGARAQAILELTKLEVLDRLPGLDITDKIHKCRNDLAGAFLVVMNDRSEASEMKAQAYADLDAEAVATYVESILGPKPPKTHPTYTIEQIRTHARNNYYPNLEALGMIFTEHKAKPYRSTMIVPTLLNRVPGVDASEQIKLAMRSLEEGYNGVPTTDGSKVGDATAKSTALTAQEKTVAAIDNLLGPTIKL